MASVINYSPGGDPSILDENGRDDAAGGPAAARGKMRLPAASRRDTATPQTPQTPQTPGTPGRRRTQWGGDRRTTPLPAVPQPVSDRRVAMARLAIVVTVIGWVSYLVWWLFADFFRPGFETAADRAEAVLYLLIVTLLTASAVAYLISRMGYFYRTRTQHRASRAALDEFFDATTPALTTIIPSYQEDTRVIRNTLLSAALQEYPDKRVVLLIDDPFVPKTAEAAGQLAAARALPDEISRLLAAPASRFGRAVEAFEARCAGGEQPGPGSMIALARRAGDDRWPDGATCPGAAPLIRATGWYAARWPSLAGLPGRWTCRCR